MFLWHPEGVRSQLSFLLGERKGGARTVVPEIDGVSLIQRLDVFDDCPPEKAGKRYGGIVPSYFHYGDLFGYFLGINDRQWPETGAAWVLGCDCGDVGCRPFKVGIELTQEAVTWAVVPRMHPNGLLEDQVLGPFEFDRHQYESAVRDLISRLGM